MDLDTLRARTNTTPNLLILLVGENPLPNYVVAKLLSGKQTTLILVYSPDRGQLPGTGAAKDALKGVLDGSAGETASVPFEAMETLDVDESDAHDVATKVAERVRRLSAGLVLMNYTGGTKAMATHAYAAAREACTDHKDLYGCYLDARRLQLRLERWPLGNIPHSAPFDVNQRVDLKFETMLAIHGRVGPQLRRQPLLPNTATAIATLHQHDTTRQTYQRWLAETFFKPWSWPGANESDLRANPDLQFWAYSKGACALQWQKLKKLLEMSFVSPPSVNDALQADLHAGPFATWADLFEAAQRFYGAHVPDIFSKRADKADRIGKWFEGQWLEDYVLWSWLAQPEAARGDALAGAGIGPTGDDFEIDVALVRGYQLFGISCTTDTNKGLCKSKLLEVYARAEQLGGAEARVGLISFYDKPEALTREVAGLVNAQRLKIFGPGDLPQIGEHLAEWVRASSGEQL
ncbi:MAG: hypothetical protein OHK0015_46240 [Chloroflexi bacterium OHK40]